MSLANAIELIKEQLPPSLAVAVGQALAQDMSARELTIEGFSTWQVHSVQALRFIVQRRLVACESPIKERWHRAQLELLDASSQAAGLRELWQGYFVDGETRRFFLLDLGLNRLCVGPYP